MVSNHPKYPEGSAAAAKAPTMPVPIDAPKIKYTEADDRAIDEYIKDNSKCRCLYLQESLDVFENCSVYYLALRKY
jgi:hypothetical protein